MGMQHKKRRGFTIIEVMLFLAVSGTLAVGILATASVGINSQRYRDALNSLQSLLQQQYNETAHVINDRPGDRLCNNNGIQTPGNGVKPEALGTSECVIIGRYIAITGGQSIAISSVVGYKASSPPKSSDLEELQGYKLFIENGSTTVSEIAWSGKVTVTDAGAEVDSPGMLILRSPLTGAVRTFVFPQSEVSNNVVADGVVSTDTMIERKLCLNRDLFSVGVGLGVVIRANAANASAIELLGDDGGC